MVDVRKFSDIDLYGLLEIEITATESEVCLNFIEFTYKEHSKPNLTFYIYV